MASWPVTLLCPIKFIKISVPCTAIGCNIVTDHEAINQGLRETHCKYENPKNTAYFSVYERGKIVCLGHRFGEARGLRRRKHSTHSAMASIVHISKSEKGGEKAPTVTPSKAKFDHSPHEVRTDHQKVTLFLLID